MKEKTAVIEIDEQGNSTIDLDGFQGKGCADVAKAFQGHDVVKTSRTKADFYIQQTTLERQKQNS
jgi:hypothetical protein